MTSDKELLDNAMGRTVKMSAGEFQKIIDEMKADYKFIGERLLNFGRNYVRLIAAGKESEAKEAFPDIPEIKWEQFALCGMGKIAPALLVYSHNGANLIRRLPVKDQEVILSKPIDVLVIRENGQTDSIKAEFKSLTGQQQRQVVAYDHIRTLPEQRAYVESQRTTEWTKSAPPENKKYVISNGKVVFPSKAEFTESELWAIVKELAGRKK